MKTSSISLRHSLSSLALMAAFAAPSTFAATITVHTNVDTVGSGSCSLRDAVLSVNAGSDQPGGCFADMTDPYGTNDTINLAAGTYRLALGGLDEVQGATPADPVVNTTNATIGDLDLLKSVKIIGAGSATTRIEWDPAETDPSKTDRIFHIYNTEAVANNVNVAIQGVTLTSGKTIQVDLLVDPAAANFHYYLRRAGGALALGAAAAVVHIDTPHSLARQTPTQAVWAGPRVVNPGLQPTRCPCQTLSSMETVQKVMAAAYISPLQLPRRTSL